MERIVFYEDKNFQGRSHECKTDTSDLHTFFGRCNSVRVDSGCWVLYERPNFMGYQYVLTPGEYPEYQRWVGFNDCIRSCRVIKSVSSLHRLKLYDRPGFGGQVVEVTDSLPAAADCIPGGEVHSCRVSDGLWVFYEHANYRGRQYLLEKGEYGSYADWGSPHAAVGSIRHVTEF